MTFEQALDKVAQCAENDYYFTEDEPLEERQLRVGYRKDVAGEQCAGRTAYESFPCFFRRYARSHLMPSEKTAKEVGECVVAPDCHEKSEQEHRVMRPVEEYHFVEQRERYGYVDLRQCHALPVGKWVWAAAEKLRDYERHDTESVDCPCYMSVQRRQNLRFVQQERQEQYSGGDG